jgi:hypothetical protein
MQGESASIIDTRAVIISIESSQEVHGQTVSVIDR